MTNHVHMLIKENEEIGKSIKRITVGYVQWYNNKYGRTGHLFQNRYRSETVEDEKYLLTVLRYIHQNPLKAEIVSKMEEYAWSSYKDYILNYDGKETGIDTELIMGYFKTQKEFKNFMNESNDDEFLEYEEKKKYTEKELTKAINRIINIEQINKLPKKERDETIMNIYQATGASIRQLSKSTGIGRGIIARAIKM